MPIRRISSPAHGQGSRLALSPFECRNCFNKPSIIVRWHVCSVSNGKQSLCTDGRVDDEEESIATVFEATPDTHQDAIEQRPVELCSAVPALSQPPPPAAPLNTFSSEGVILALSIVSASCLGRLTSQEARLDVRRVQRTRERSRALSSELRSKREAWRIQEAERLASVEAQRVADVTIRAREAAKEQAQLRRKYEEDAAREKERIQAEQEAARKVYDKQQAVLDAEYKARVEQEQRLIEEARQRAKEEEERRRVEVEKQRKIAEQERMRREEEERLMREAEVRRKIEERRRLEQEKQRFAVRLEGSVTVERPPKGTIIAGALQREASIRISVGAGSLLGGQIPGTAVDFSSPEDAGAAVPTLVAQQARAACDGAASAMRLQSMTGQGPMSAMDQPEQGHWMAMAAARTAVAGLIAAEASIAAFRKAPTAGPHANQFNIRTEVGVLPKDHPQRPEAVMGRAIALIEGGHATQAVDDVLIDSMQAENESFYSGLDTLPNCLSSAPRVLGSALELAHFLGRMLHDRPAKTSDAPAWFESAAALIREQLRVLFKGSPPDSLEPIAAILGAALGSNHPVAREVIALAQANISAAEMARRSERDRVRQAELAAKLLEEEWPDAKEIRAARLEERESKTPVAERVWALRNVAGTLAMGGPGERSRARQLLEQAVSIKQQFAGAPDHPAVLPELAALSDVLGSEPEWATDAAGVAALVLRLLGNIAEGYSQIGDNTSAALIMEAGLRQYEEAAGVRSSAVKAATRRSDKLLEGLTEDQRQAVTERRSMSKDIISVATLALTEQLGAYKEGSTRSKAQDWDERGALVIGPLV